MSDLACVGISIALAGVALPLWVFLAIAVHTSKKPTRLNPGVRFTAYAALIDRIFYEMDKERNQAAIIIAAFREFRAFPEYRDISLSLLGVIDVDGRTPNDYMLIEELKATEDYLLSLKK